MFRAILCRLRGHKIDRKRVWYDDLDFRTNCRNCGAPMVRTMRGWRVFNSETDGDARRLGHPRDRKGT